MNIADIPERFLTCLKIEKDDDGYSIFTIPTQHFRVKTITDLDLNRLLYEENRELNSQNFFSSIVTNEL